MNPKYVLWALAVMNFIFVPLDIAAGRYPSAAFALFVGVFCAYAANRRVGA